MTDKPIENALITNLGSGLILPRPVGSQYLITARFGQLTDRHGKKLWGEIGHTGTDFATPIGTQAECVYDGEVIYSQYHEVIGLAVWIVSEYRGVKFAHNYAHGSNLLCKDGDRIRAGQPVLLTGNSGKSTGPHLHFKICLWPSRIAIDPKY